MYISYFALAGPHLLNMVVLAMADGLFGLCGSEREDELFISTRSRPPLPFPSFPSLISLMVFVDIKHRKKGAGRGGGEGGDEEELD